MDFRDVNVLIIGDVMIDRYMIGDIFRQSPEADIPVLENISIENRLGGAANVALNIKGLGATPFLCGVVGNDDNSQVFMEEMNKEALSTELIFADDSRKTTVKTRVISNDKHIVRVDMEDTHDLDENIRINIIDKLKSFIRCNKIDIIIYQDYNKGVLTPMVINNIRTLAIEFDIPTAVDPKKSNFFEFMDISIFKPNRKEVEDQFGEMASISIPVLDSIATKIRKINSAKNILITLSENGIYYNDGIKSGISPVISNDIVDVSGAGDSVLSIICLGFIKKYNILRISKLANIVGGLACANAGVRPVSIEELKSQLRHIV